MTPDTSPTLQALRASRGTGRRRKRNDNGRPCVIGYLRVSGQEQKATGLGLEAQEAAIRAECERRGWKLCVVEKDEAVSGKVRPDKRPGLKSAIRALDAGKASILLVAKIDRVARSLRDLLLLDELGQRQGWHIVALNAPFDTTTPQGKMMRDLLGAFAELESAMGSERMKAVAAVRRARGNQLGRPSTVSPEARQRLGELRAEGLSWAKVAEAMNAEGWTTSQGKRWLPTTCQRLAPPR